jgi:Fe2+ transport system protein B
LHRMKIQNHKTLTKKPTILNLNLLRKANNNHRPKTQFKIMISSITETHQRISTCPINLTRINLTPINLTNTVETQNNNKIINKRKYSSKNYNLSSQWFPISPKKIGHSPTCTSSTYLFNKWFGTPIFSWCMLIISRSIISLGSKRHMLFWGLSLFTRFPSLEKSKFNSVILIKVSKIKKTLSDKFLSKNNNITKRLTN